MKRPAAALSSQPESVAEPARFNVIESSLCPSQARLCFALSKQSILEAGAIDNGAQREVKNVLVVENEFDAQEVSGPRQVTDEPPSKKGTEADNVQFWTEKAQELSREYLTRSEADHRIVAAFRAVRMKPKPVKSAFRDDLQVADWEATRYRAVWEDDFLDEPETAKVFGTLTLSQQYELAKASPTVQLKMRFHRLIGRHTPT